VHVDRIVKYHSDDARPDAVELTEQLMQRMRRRAGIAEILDITWDSSVVQPRRPDNTYVRVRYQGLPEAFHQKLSVEHILAARPQLLKQFFGIRSTIAAKQAAIDTLRSAIYG